MTRFRLRQAIADEFGRRGYIVFGDSPMVIVGPSKVAFLEPTATNEPTGDPPNFRALRDYRYAASRVRTVEEAREAIDRAPHKTPCGEGEGAK